MGMVSAMEVRGIQVFRESNLWDWWGGSEKLSPFPTELEDKTLSQLVKMLVVWDFSADRVLPDRMGTPENS
jgi:hypothetical protein